MVDEPFQQPIEERLDLDAFQPRELPFLFSDYLTECRKSDIREVHLAHSREILGSHIEEIHEAVMRTRGLVSYKEDGWYRETVVILETGGSS